MIRRLALLTLAVAVVPNAAPAQDNPSVTLFSSGRTIVRRTLPVSVPNGTSTHALPLGIFDASSLSLLDPGVSLVRIGFDPAWSEDALLRRSIGRSFAFRGQGDKPGFTATLIGMDPERWELDNVQGKGVVFGRPGQILWPRDLIPAGPVADVTVQSDRARQGLKVLYGARGGSWNATYRLFVGDQGRIEGVASIMAGPLDLQNAEVQLLAGDIGQPPPSAPSPVFARNQAMEMSVKMDGGVPSEESIGEARLYTLPGRVSFVPGTQIVIPLFAPVAARAERRLAVRGMLPWWGGFGQDETEQEVPVEVSYRLERKIETAFGALPMPAGGISVFEMDRAGRTQLIGQGAIGHTGPGEELNIRTGTAFDVTATRTQIEYTSTSTARPQRTTTFAAWRVDLQNAKDSAVTVDVIEERRGDWSVVSSSVPAQRRSATRTVFPVTIPAKGTASVTYRVRVVW
ncbi:MAG: hypothetical protein ABIR59_10610 [Gemmatimonadales bacterium]